MIRFENVYKSFSTKPILQGLDMHVNKGETMVIVGGSGTGKSVSLKHMVALLKPDSGKVLIDGDDITQASGSKLIEIRSKFGVLFQSGALLNWMTIEQNIGLPLYEKTKLGDEEIREKVHHVMEQVDLIGSEKKTPSEISGGMKKRAALARAIITEPDILLYDEPTSGLDPVMSRHVDQMIIDMQKQLGVTSVVVTHDLHSAFSIADKITMLYEGKNVESSPPKDFMNSEHPFVRDFIKAQFSTVSLEGITL